MTEVESIPLYTFGSVNLREAIVLLAEYEVVGGYLLKNSSQEFDKDFADGEEIKIF